MMFHGDDFTKKSIRFIAILLFKFVIKLSNYFLKSIISIF